MSTLCVLLVFVATSRSASIEEDYFDETKVHPLSDEYIEYINNVQSLWQAGRNFEVDTPIEYLRQLAGAKPKADRSGLKEKEFPVDMIQNLPESFDAREHWPDCPSLSEIRSQGNCGSCWAISTTEVITDRTCIASHGKVQFHYSTFDLLTCCVNCGDGCKYGIPGLAWEHWIHKGIVSGGNYDSKDKGCKPYPFPNNYNYSLEHGHFDDKNISLKCTNKCVSSDIDYNEDKRFGKDYFYMSQNEDQIKTEILNHGPVQATFDIYFDFINYRSGIYRAVTNQTSNASHAVKILGWGVENGTKYWLIANSWGEKWGENGYFRIVRGENHCNIEDDIYAGVVEDSHIIKKMH